jgi:hypothetical protein
LLGPPDSLSESGIAAEPPNSTVRSSQTALRRNAEEEEDRAAEAEHELDGRGRAGSLRERSGEWGSGRRMHRGDKNASRGRRVAAPAVCLSISLGASRHPPMPSVSATLAGPGPSAHRVGQGTRDQVRDPRGGPLGGFHVGVRTWRE